MERVNARHVIRKNGRRVAAFTGPVAAIAWLADETGFTQETVAEETRGNSALVDDVGHEWTITLEDA